MAVIGPNDQTDLKSISAFTEVLKKNASNVHQVYMKQTCTVDVYIRTAGPLAVPFTSRGLCYKVTWYQSLHRVGDFLFSLTWQYLDQSPRSTWSLAWVVEWVGTGWAQLTLPLDRKSQLSFMQWGTSQKYCWDVSWLWWFQHRVGNGQL